MTDNEKVASIFRAARKLTGKTQVEVAKHLGVSQSCISKIEASKLLPSVSEWFRFAQLMGIRADESFHYGYLDNDLPVQANGAYLGNSFKIPAKYLRHPHSKVRTTLPFIQYFQQQLGHAKLKQYLEREKIDPDFFLVYDNQLSPQFTLDLVTKLIESGVLKSQDLEKLAQSLKTPAMHGRLQLAYEGLTTGKELIGALIGHVDHYETNFAYQLEEQNARGLTLSVAPRPHLAEIDYRNETLGDFICSYRKQYLVEFSTYSGAPPVRIAEKQCHFHGSDQCIYQIQTA